jgi:hypothetical protein
MKRAKKVQGPPTVAAYEMLDDGMTATIRVDNLRRGENETDEAMTARARRLGWARKELLDWLKAPIGGQVVWRVMSDGSKAVATMTEVRDALHAPDAIGTWEIKASAPVALADMVPTSGPEVVPIETPTKASRKRKGAIDVVAEPSTELAVIPRAAVVADVPQDAPTDPLFGLSRAVFTIGYEGMLPEHLDRIVAALGITAIVDTRANTLARKGWSSNSLRTRFGTRYRTAQTLADVAAHVVNVTKSASGVVLLLRKEKAPGNNAFHLEIAKLFQVTHIFEAEFIDGAALQKALDADAMDPSPDADHPYDCVEMVPDEGEEEQRATA